MLLASLQSKLCRESFYSILCFPIQTCVLLQACISTVSLGSSSTETRLVNNAVVKDGHGIIALITALNWWILKTPRWQWTTTNTAATNNVSLESVGTDIAALWLANLIAAMSLQCTGVTITVAVIDVSTSTQRMVLNVTCHTAVVTAVALCSPIVATAYCCYCTSVGVSYQYRCFLTDPVSATYSLTICTCFCVSSECKQFCQWTSWLAC